jgi:hypothetical protein
MLETEKATVEPSEELTAQTITDALSASPYMDHVVNSWIAAYGNLRAASAINDYVNRNNHPFECYPTQEFTEAKVAFNLAYRDMVDRWNEYNGN